MNDANRSVRNHLLAGAVAVAFLFGGFGAWAHLTEFHGAVIGAGQLVVDGNVKKVQHPTGGVVASLHARDGARVRTGDLLVRLDDTQTRANLSIVTKALDELGARRAREEAERDDMGDVAFPDDLVARTGDPDVAKLMAGERRLFGIRRATREGQKGQLRERVAQLRQEIVGIEAQERAKAGESGWIDKELEGVRDLWSKNLIQFQRVTVLERERARIEGERGHLQAAKAQAGGKIVETEIQILQVDQEMRSEVGRDLAEIRGKTAELMERRVAAEDQLKRVDIRSPQDGFVHQTTVHTVGGVVVPNGEPVMLVVPEADALRVEVRVQPQDIDQLRVGQEAVVRFPSFDPRTTPDLKGELSHVAADVVQDQRSGATFYLARVSIPEEETSRIPNAKLVPGMPAEVFVQTARRTVLSYLMKPVTDQVSRAFRER